LIFLDTMTTIEPTYLWKENYNLFVSIGINDFSNSLCKIVKIICLIERDYITISSAPYVS
jgi:hypothetical protein